MKVLLVCTANICRSPYAELVARELAGPGSSLEFSSAGVRAGDGDPMDPVMAAEAASRGAEPGSFRSRRLTNELIDDADLILTAESAHRKRILEERPLAMRNAFSLGQFARGLQAVPPGPADDLLARVRAKAATAVSEDDVADPYGRGHGPAQLAAMEIDALLKLILPTLV
jgi:sulfate adenylyltransferase